MYADASNTTAHTTVSIDQLLYVVHAGTVACCIMQFQLHWLHVGSIHLLCLILIYLSILICSMRRLV